jgi:hypothetical protein
MRWRVRIIFQRVWKSSMTTYREDFEKGIWLPPPEKLVQERHN